MEELACTASDSDKLNSIVTEKNTQISILKKNMDNYHENTTQLETKYEFVIYIHFFFSFFVTIEIK